MSKLRPAAVALLLVGASIPLVGQDTQRVEFDVVAIKRNTTDSPNSGSAFAISEGGPLGLIRFRGHIPKGGYDVHTDGRYDSKEQAPAPAVR